jgi:hypothetical protein
MISTRARKILWTQAHNQCAFPGCLQSLVEQESTTTESAHTEVLGEEAHIRAQSAGGPRYDPTFTDVHGHENLILLCPTHHAKIDANNGAGYTVLDLITIKTNHERNHERRRGLSDTLNAYIGDRYQAENTVQFQQADLRGPSVDTMFVDVPLGYRSDASELASLLKDISESAPGDINELRHNSELIITGATQALLHPEWSGNAVLVGGPGQGKSTLLQYICQFHRARRLGDSKFTAGMSNLARASSTSRFPIRIDLRRYAQWAVAPAPRTKKGKKEKTQPENPEHLRSLEIYLMEEVGKHVGAHTFTAHDFISLLATEPVLLALDGLDEVASLTARERVVEEIARMRGRLRTDAADLVILVTTRPGTSLQPLTASGAFPVLHLQRLTQGLRLQYLDQWCEVSNLSPEATEKLRSTFMHNQNVPHINELASYPMQLAILLHLLHRRQLLPQQRTELYEEYLKTFLDREQGEDKEPLLAEQRGVVEDTHAYLGWYLQSKAEEGQTAGSISRDELKQVLHTYLAGRPRAQELAQELYSAITDRVLCLVERNDAFEFEVQSLREYFAALHIFENLTPKGNGNSRDDGLNALLERPYWANVCRFFVGKLARGEIRGLISNFQTVEKKLAPHPLIRAMAVTVLNDRIYNFLASTEIRAVVDFILDGPGVIFGRDGLLDPAGSPLRLNEQAGRIQVVDHLKERLESKPTSSERATIAGILAAHATSEDDISAWWWDRFEPTISWLEVAAHLAIFVDLGSERLNQLIFALNSCADSPIWISNLLSWGSYNGANDVIAQSTIDSLNDGSAEVTNAHLVLSDIGELSCYASDAISGLNDRTIRISGSRVHARSLTSIRMGKILDSLPNIEFEVSSPNDWKNYLSVVANAWGDGWVLRRCIATVPRTIELALIVARTQSAVLATAVQTEADYRQNRSDTDWWREQISSSDDERELMFKVLALLENARSFVLVGLAQDLDTAVGKLSPKRYRAVEQALVRSFRAGQNRIVDLKESLRLRTVSFSGRTLWLLWIVATESTRERLAVHLESDLQDVFSAGATDGREAVRAARTTRKLKVDAFHNSRSVLSSGGWADQSRVASINLKTAKEILKTPSDWPMEIVQLAADQLGARAAKVTAPLIEIAIRDKWLNS